VIAAASLARAPRRARIVSRRPARRHPRNRECSRSSGAEDEPSRARGLRREPKHISEPDAVLSRRIHLWAWAGRRGRVTQRDGMHRARVSSARRRAHRAPRPRGDVRARRWLDPCVSCPRHP
jgi:hypothetical protein